MAGGILNDPARRGLIANAALFVAATVIVNGIVFAAGWSAAPAAIRPPLIPPGPVVGAVWTLLFALMGAARWAAVRDLPDGGGDRRRDDGNRWRRALPAVLAVVCLAFPFYTRGFSDQPALFAGTLATCAVVVFMVALLVRRSRQAALLLAPTAVWTGWVSMVGIVFGRI